MLVRASRILLFLAPLSLLPPTRATAADAGLKPPAPPPATASAAAVAPSAPATVAAKAAPKPPKTAKKPKAPKNPPVVLYTVNHKETFSLRLRDAQGKPVKGNQKRFDCFLRCHHTETKHSMNPRLMRCSIRLAGTGRESGWRWFRVPQPEGREEPAQPPHEGPRVRLPRRGRQTTELRDYLRKNFDKVGVGYYPNSTFVHLDVRKDRSAFWIDYSGPGERAVYSENPGDDLRTGRADSYHPTKSMNPGRRTRRQCRGTAPRRPRPGTTRLIQEKRRNRRRRSCL